MARGVQAVLKELPEAALAYFHVLVVFNYYSVHFIAS